MFADIAGERTASLRSQRSTWIATQISPGAIGVQRLPTLVLFVEGVLAATVVGARPKARLLAGIDDVFGAAAPE